MKLSDRIRPDSEAAPWVVDAVITLEQELEAAKAKIQSLEVSIRPVTDTWHSQEPRRRTEAELPPNTLDVWNRVIRDMNLVESHQIVFKLRDYLAASENDIQVLKERIAKLVEVGSRCANWTEDTCAEKLWRELVDGE